MHSVQDTRHPDDTTLCTYTGPTASDVPTCVPTRPASISQAEIEGSRDTPSIRLGLYQSLLNSILL